jgi:putative PIN family toxin of toxin-antitoxin system
MTNDLRVVLDTNVLVSHLLLASSIPGQVVRKAIREAEILLSEVTLQELHEVLARRKFDTYVSSESRVDFFRVLAANSTLVPIIRSVTACRDPKDDKFPEVAINGSADLIVTGDQDLLALDPFHGVTIMNPTAYLKR